MAGNVFFFTAGSSKNWDRTISQPVELKRLEQLLPAPHLEFLRAKASGRPLFAWGAQAGAVGTIAGMSEDDVVFGSRQGRVGVAAFIALSLKEPSDVLSIELWDAPDWPYVYFLHGAVFGERPVPDFLAEMGERGRLVQGFRISHSASKILRSADSPLEFVRRAMGLPRPEAARPHAERPPEPQTYNPVDVLGHAEAQADLIRIGESLGLDVWVASNDRSKSVREYVFRDHTIESLPFQGQPAFHRQIELIDVIWLQGAAIRAAFEVEHSTSVYSGLLRLGDLVTQFPTLAFPLYVVAPDADKKRICSQIARPLFRAQGLDLICHYIPYSRLRDAVGDVLRFGKHLNPRVIQDYTVPCAD